MLTILFCVEIIVIVKKTLFFLGQIILAIQKSYLNYN